MGVVPPNAYFLVDNKLFYVASIKGIQYRLRESFLNTTKCLYCNTIPSMCVGSFTDVLLNAIF